MVDEFQNERPDVVGDRVRESVAELCGVLDELIEEEDATSNGRTGGPSLREQLVDSWQGKSYYERLQNIVDADVRVGDLRLGRRVSSSSFIARLSLLHPSSLMIWDWVAVFSSFIARLTFFNPRDNVNRSGRKS